MSAKLVAIHKMPKDPERYRSYYLETHLPLALKLPGLRKYELNQGPISGNGGDQQTLLVAIIHFDSLSDIDIALASPAGLAALEDLPNFATPDNIQILTFETYEP